MSRKTAKRWRDKMMADPARHDAYKAKKKAYDAQRYRENGARQKKTRLDPNDDATFVESWSDRKRRRAK